MRKDAGVTMLEVLFGVAVVGLGAYYLAETISSTGKDFQLVADGMISNLITQQYVAGVRNTSGLYPALQDRSGKPGFYAICSNRKGVLSVDSAGNPQRFAVFSGTAGSASGKCAGSEVETQFVPSAQTPSLITIFVLFFDKSSGRLISTHQQQLRMDRNI